MGYADEREIHIFLFIDIYIYIRMYTNFIHLYM